MDGHNIDPVRARRHAFRERVVGLPRRRQGHRLPLRELRQRRALGMADRRSGRRPGPHRRLHRTRRLPLPGGLSREPAHRRRLRRLPLRPAPAMACRRRRRARRALVGRGPPRRQHTDLSSRWEGHNWLAVVVWASSGSLPLRARLSGRLVDGPHRACPFLLPRSGHRTVRGLGQDRDTRVGSRHVRPVIPRQRRSRGRVGSALVLGLFHRRYDPRFNRQRTGRLLEPGDGRTHGGRRH